MNYERKGYPRPQFVRSNWVNLNGLWTYKIMRDPPAYLKNYDFKEQINSKGFDKEILVPFPPESKASGVNEDEIISCMFYHRSFNISSELKNKKLLLHFGAVFYHCEMYINGEFVDFHDGGSTSFCLDISKFVKIDKENDLVIKVLSNLQDGSIPSGKQSSFISSYSCYYKRTTGIWQTVWLEIVDEYSLNSVRTIWDNTSNSLIFTPLFNKIREGQTLSISIIEKESEVSNTTVSAVSGFPICLKINNPRLWDTKDPFLYNLKYTVKTNDVIIDEVSSYIGLRTVSINNGYVYLNGKKIYQRLVLDQGFYEEGNWSAPSDEALEADIKLSIAAGFNGARLHQKVFEEKYFYYADKLGYLVWAESPSWGLDYNNEALPHRNYLSEWVDIIKRDINHPCIIAWTPLNETFLFKDFLSHKRLHRDAYNLAKEIDPSRLVNDASGYIHFITDLWTVHTYEQNPKKLKEQLALKDGKPFRCFPIYESEYDGQPYLVDEFGGIKWDPITQGDSRFGNDQNLKSWGYGEAPKNKEEFYNRLEAQIKALLTTPHIVGYCYTQLTDVEQEKNGIYFYSREKKFDMNKIKTIFKQIPKGFDD